MTKPEVSDEEAAEVAVMRSIEKLITWPIVDWGHLSSLTMKATGRQAKGDDAVGVTTAAFENFVAAQKAVIECTPASKVYPLVALRVHSAWLLWRLCMAAALEANEGENVSPMEWITGPKRGL